MDPFHDGARLIQEWAGERDRAVLNGRTITPTVPAAAHGFVRQQPHCIAGWQRPDGAVWATVIAAAPGFASVGDDGRSITLAPETSPRTGWPGGGHPEGGDHLGLLFLEFSTRRRLRIHGRVAELNPVAMRVDVDAAFANCPKYIQRRTARPPQPPSAVTSLARSGVTLTDDLRGWIRDADTLFVASARQDGHADVSHRGGAPGFVVLDNATLRIPDYSGNSMFLTLGNLHVQPRAGLTFIDFDRRRQLALTGTASLDFIRGDLGDTADRRVRWWSFHPHEWSVTALPPSFDWVLQERSPFNP